MTEFNLHSKQSLGCGQRLELLQSDEQCKGRATKVLDGSSIIFNVLCCHSL